MKVKIKDKGWIDYTYAISCLPSVAQTVKEALEKQGYKVEYLGRSKAVKYDDQEVHQLKKRASFFNISKDNEKISHNSNTCVKNL